MSKAYLPYLPLNLFHTTLAKKEFKLIKEIFTQSYKDPSNVPILSKLLELENQLLNNEKIDLHLIRQELPGTYNLMKKINYSHTNTTARTALLNFLNEYIKVWSNIATTK